MWNSNIWCLKFPVENGKIKEILQKGDLTGYEKEKKYNSVSGIADAYMCMLMRKIV